MWQTQTPTSPEICKDRVTEIFTERNRLPTSGRIEHATQTSDTPGNFEKVTSERKVNENCNENTSIEN